MNIAARNPNWMMRSLRNHVLDTHSDCLHDGQHNGCLKVITLTFEKPVKSNLQTGQARRTLPTPKSLAHAPSTFPI